MHDEEIVLYYNEYRLDALRVNLAEQNTDLKKELYKMLELLYEETVPDKERNEVERFVEKQAYEEAERREAERLFAVFHIRENGEDYHFTSDYFTSAMQAAYRYRLYERGKLSANPQTLADAFIETDPISLDKFNEACTDMNSDQRITALLEFDLDEGRISICDSSDNSWQTYSLHDFSVAAFKAYRSEYRDTACCREIFYASLCGKEIDTEISEDTGMTM